MPLVTTAELVTGAAATRSAVAAFNIITLEHVEAVVAGAESLKAPVVLQVSENAVRFRYGRLHPLARAAVTVAERAAVPVALHLDHVQSDELLRQAADAGFSSVMYDAARLSYTENLAATRAAADWAHSQGLWIEAELGGRRQGQRAPAGRPRPRRTHRPRRGPHLRRGLRRRRPRRGHRQRARDDRTQRHPRPRPPETSRHHPGRPLVLHGSSGVRDDELTAAVAGGIAKVNVGTALNIAMTGAIREFLAAHPEAVDSRKYLSVGRDAMAEAARRIIGMLGR